MCVCAATQVREENRPRSYPPLFIGERAEQRRTSLTHFCRIAFAPWELCVSVSVSSCVFMCMRRRLVRIRWVSV